jgi:forkhead box protein J2/3
MSIYFATNCYLTRIYFHRFEPPFPPHLLPPPPGIPGILPPFNVDEAFDMDEHGNLDWKSMWKKELNQLIQVTEEQEKTGVDQEWFRIMLWKLRAAFFTPPPPPAGHPGHPPHPGHPGHPGHLPHTPVLQPPQPPNVGSPDGVVMGGVPVQQVQQDR